MKTKKRLPKLATRVLSGALLVNVLTASSFAPGKATETIRGDDPADKNKIHKKRSGKKSRAVRIFPDLIKRTMHVVSKEINDGSIDFFVFGVDGTLMLNHRLNPGDHIKISDLERGSYIYQVFDGDEMSETGKLEIK